MITIFYVFIALQSIIGALTVLCVVGLMRDHYRCKRYELEKEKE